jgi:hypothetical protein
MVGRFLVIQMPDGGDQRMMAILFGLLDRVMLHFGHVQHLVRVIFHHVIADVRTLRPPFRPGLDTYVTPTLALLDFSGVAVATASFLRESVIGFRDYARQALPNIYPVVANLPPPSPRSWTSSSARAATSC